MNTLFIDEPKTKRFVKPTPDQVTEYGKSIGFRIDGEEFYDFYESKGWKIGISPMKDWQAAVRTWKKRRGEKTKPKDIHRRCACGQIAQYQKTECGICEAKRILAEIQR